ncbi:MAG: hypothetical protein ACE14S_09915 [Candidatus Bathyarchaeia archaeon]
MTENEEENATELTGFLSSKFWRTLMIIVAVFLIFAGPTYFVYLLAVVLNVALAASAVVGIVLFVVGLVLMWYLVRKGVVS